MFPISLLVYLYAGALLVMCEAFCLIYTSDPKTQLKLHFVGTHSVLVSETILLDVIDFLHINKTD